MQGARSNTGRRTVPLSGPKATRLTAGGQPAPVVSRPVAATPNVPRSGSREIARVDSAGMAEAGTQTTGGQPVQMPVPPKT